MKKRLLPLVAAGALLAFGPVHAQMMGMRSMGMGSAYGEVGLSQVDVSGNSFSADPLVLRGIVGAEVHPYMAVEGMLGFGVREDSARLAGVPVDVEVKHTWGLFAKPKVMVGDRVEVYGRLGYARTKVDASGLGLNRSDTEGDFAYGLGANFNITPRTYAGLDWMQYYDKGGNKADGFTLSVGMRF